MLQRLCVDGFRMGRQVDQCEDGCGRGHRARDKTPRAESLDEARAGEVRQLCGSASAGFVQCGRRLLSHSGPSKIKVRRITETAGVSTIAVYHHFGGLLELLQAVVSRGYLLLREAFDHATDADPDPGVQLFAMALSTRELAQRNPHLYDMMFGLSTRGTYRYVGERSDSSAHFDEAYSVLVTACDRLVRSGRIAVGDAEQVAAELWSAVHGFVTLEGASHFARFDDPVHSVLAPMAVNHFVGMGDNRSRAERSAAAALAWWEAR